ncbi:MAG: hypothetical protein RLZZ116_482 [Planctomycetota bacterium]|jgi:uncharacterized protein YecE (DUF72 family)
MKRKNEATPSLFNDATEPPSAADAASLAPAAATEMQRTLAQRLPSSLYLGTSSWSFPGWNGLVYDRKASESTLARVGLESYAKHPLFRSVGVDKTFYRPAPRREFERLAAQVPASFRFLVKMWRGVVERESFTPSTAPSAFLDARVADVECVRPAVEGLGEKAGPLLFQFPPMRLAGAGAAREFLGGLRRFLAGLPRGPLYAVEVRNRTLVGAELGEMLADAGAVPCLTVHPTMPDVEAQSRELALDPARPLVMRWMLRGNHEYEEAKDLYAPFDRLVEPDDASRDALARLARSALDAGIGTWVIVNNKAEGSSPLSVERLAARIAG